MLFFVPENMFMCQGIVKRTGNPCVYPGIVDGKWCRFHCPKPDLGECVICRDPLHQRDHPQVCGHTFHLQCIGQWLEINNSCPCCRTQLAIDNTPVQNHAVVFTPHQFTLPQLTPPQLTPPQFTPPQPNSPHVTYIISPDENTPSFHNTPIIPDTLRTPLAVLSPNSINPRDPRRPQQHRIIASQNSVANLDNIFQDIEVDLDEAFTTNLSNVIRDTINAHLIIRRSREIQ